MNGIGEPGLEVAMVGVCPVVGGSTRTPRKPWPGETALDGGGWEEQNGQGKARVKLRMWSMSSRGGSTVVGGCEGWFGVFIREPMAM